MSIINLLIGLFCVVAGATAVGATPREGDAAVVRDLEALSRQSVFFGHQSVGMNLIQGLRELAARERVPLRIEERTSAAGLVRGTLGHGWIAENSDPLRKMRSFDAALASETGPDVAFMKLCYVDIGPDTDVAALFAAYRTTMDTLRARHPRTTFVHVTVPLTTVQGGIKAMVKWLLDRPPYGLLENARREEFNALLRRVYEGREPLFDLARLESTTPAGATETVSWKGRTVPALVAAYTDDGGHLNEEGRARAARALVTSLATATRVATPPSGGR